MGKKEKVQKILIELKKLFPNPKIALDYSNSWELLVAVVLSAQTTDKQVNTVTPTLFKKYPTTHDFAKVPLPELENSIRNIGLYKGKAKNIKATAEIITKEYKGVIPNSMDKLVALPGIGRKTANILLSLIYNMNEGIAVDTHVKRLSILFGLSDQKDPSKIEKDLMEIVPKKDWGNFTYLLIDYGRKYCPAHCKHTNCPLRFLL